MNYHVSAVTLAVVILVMSLCILGPIVLMVMWRLKTQAKWKSALVGAIAFVLFALVLENIFQLLAITLMGIDINNPSLLFIALFGGLCAGVFEEVGRYLAMKLVIKKDLDKKNAIMYGIGHGGIESILIIGMAYISNIALILMINSGQIEALMAGMSEIETAALIAQVEGMVNTPSTLYLLAIVERAGAVIMHLVMSYGVYKAVKENKIVYLFLMILLHAVMDAGMVLLAQMMSAAGVEVVLIIFACSMLYLMVKDYKRCAD